MGIRHLNRLLQNRCNNLLPKNIQFMSNWKVAVDINNYLYKIIDGDIIENISSFCKLMEQYNVDVIFVFDGKPPKEKERIIQDRRYKLLALRNKLEMLEKIPIKSDQINSTIESLRKKTRKIKYSEINMVKEFFIKHNEKFCISMDNTEADDLCKDMIERGTVNAILSDDMDFIGSGCENVIRSFNQVTETASLYCLSDILKDMEMTKPDFIEFCNNLKKVA